MSIQDIEVAGLAAITVRKNSGATDVGSRKRLNFIEGTNITLAISDDGTSDEIDIQITASGGGHTFAAPTITFGAVAAEGSAETIVRSDCVLAVPKLDDLATPDDNTDLDASAALHGLMSKAYASKLDGIEASADVTDATNVAAAGAVMEADATTVAMQFVIDEDTMASNLDTKVPTQQSTKAYADTKLPLAGGTLTGDVDVGNKDLHSICTATYEAIYANGNSGAAKTIDWNNGQLQSIVWTADCTITFTDPPGPGHFTLISFQDGTGGWTPTWPNTVDGPDSTLTTVSAGADAKDIWSFLYMPLAGDIPAKRYSLVANTNFGVPA